MGTPNSGAILAMNSNYMHVFSMIRIAMRPVAWAFLGILVFAARVQASAYSHGEPTDYEQWMLEMVNAARANPLGEASRLGIDLNQGLSAGRISTEAKPPLAFHPLLIQAARNHSDWMLFSGVFDHTGAGGSSPTQRAFALGYPFGVAENIAYRSSSGTLDLADATRRNHDGLFLSAGHRTNLMEPTYTVLGLGVRTGKFLGQGARSSGFTSRVGRSFFESWKNYLQKWW
jgi:uncharacterized protein YkwD